jgi:hypothetical protein
MIYSASVERSLQYRTHRLFAIYYHSHPWSCTIVVHIAGNLKTEKNNMSQVYTARKSKHSTKSAWCTILHEDRQLTKLDMKLPTSKMNMK